MLVKFQSKLEFLNGESQMDVIRSALDKVMNYIMTIGISDVLDIIIVAYLIYTAISFVRRTNSYNIAKGLIVLLLALWLSGVFRLTMINYFLRRAMELGLIAVFILFQPELRRVLEKMGSRFTAGKGLGGTEIERCITQVVLASTEMSASRTGALMIFERNVRLNDIMSTGTIINSDTTSELIKNIFYNKAPLHDGALIMRNGRIAAAGCVLPLTKSTNLSKDLGMRHRAGIGLTEQADSVVVIVSEETGSISVAVDGMLKRHLTAATLDKILRNELIPREDDNGGNMWRNSLMRIFKVKNNEENKSV